MEPKERAILRKSIVVTLYFLLVLWFVRVLEWGVIGDITHLGIHPRHWLGLIGVFLAPLIHANFMHLVQNSVAFVLINFMLFFFYDRLAEKVFIIIYLLSGILVWIIGRNAYHIGASGLIYGLASFIFFSGMIRKNLATLAVGLVVILLYGGIFYGIMPTEPHISWESHMMGFLSGMILAVVYRKKYAGHVEMELQFKEKQIFKRYEKEEEESPNFTREFNEEGAFIQYRYQYKPEKPKQKDKDNSSGNSH